MTVEGDFFSAVSHRARGHLNTVAGWAAVLRTGQASPPLMEQAAAALDRAWSFEVELLETLLELWALSEGTVKLDLRPLGLVPVIRAAIEAVTPAAAARGLSIADETEDHELETLGDRERLERLLELLLRHALERSRDGATIRVRLLADRAAARVEVSDSGPPVSASDLTHYFDRYRPAAASADAAQGTINAALAIASHLARLHHGALSARSDPAGGLTLTLAVPIS